MNVKWPTVAPIVAVLAVAVLSPAICCADGAASPPPLGCQLPHLGSPKKSSKIGGSRTDHENITVSALSPDDMSVLRTAQSAPSLFWHLSANTANPVEFSLVAVGQIEPVVIARVNGAAHGIHRVDLSSLHAALSEGVLYEWVIAVVEQEDRRSRDVVGVGFITRASQSAGPAWSDPAPNSIKQAQDFAAANSWYDDLNAVSNAIRENRSDESLREARDGLLKQGGFDDAAATPAGGANAINDDTLDSWNIIKKADKQGSATSARADGQQLDPTGQSVAQRR